MNTTRERVEKTFSNTLGPDALEKFRDDPEPFKSVELAGTNPGATVLLDSLDRIEFIMSLEDEFDIEIPDKDAESISNLDEAVAYLDRRLAPAG